MQQSSLMRFCDECGLANDPAATHCAACQSPLGSMGGVVSAPPITPVSITPTPVLEVTPGLLFAGDGQGISIWNASASGEFQPGTILNGRYCIEKEIGRGGFSVVYHATDMQGQRRAVAIKRIQFSKLSPRQSIDATETFNRELTMLARFKGVDGIPAFYEHLTDAENWYLVMQYIKGETLESHLQRAPGGYLEETEALRLSIGLAEVMQRMHNLDTPVIFRDLKPSNIMLTPDGKFFLIDFGIARNFTPGKAKDTTPLGSPGFAPPEQYGRAQTDQRSDIYSLGATLQTMLTGRDPLELRAGETPRNPQALSRNMRKLLDQMLAPDPAQRPDDMAQVKRRLEFIQNPPHREYFMGLILGLFFAPGIVFSLLMGEPNLLLLYAFILSGTFIHMILRKKLKMPKKIPDGFTHFWFYGLLTSSLPILLIALLLHFLG